MVSKFSKFIILIVASATILGSCKKEDKMSSEKQITSFRIPFGPECDINHENRQIGTQLPLDTYIDIKSIAPSITVSPGASVFPASDVKQDFTNPITYTVTAEDGSYHSYVVAITQEKNPYASIFSFSFQGEQVNGKDVYASINDSKGEVEIIVPFITDITSLAPTILISGKSIIPASGEVQNFTNPIKYTVTAENGNTKDYTVLVKRAEKLSEEKKILSFSLLRGTYYSGVIDEESKTITVTLPYSHGGLVGLTGLRTKVEVSPKASVDPFSGSDVDFTNPAKFTVTAEDGTSVDYTVRVVMQEFAPDISYISKTEVFVSQYVQVRGLFAYSGNSIILKNSTGQEYPMVLGSESEQSIDFKIPNDMQGGEYTICVTAQGKTGCTAQKLLVKEVNPQITGITPNPVIVGQPFNIIGTGFLDKGNGYGLFVNGVRTISGSISNVDLNTLNHVGVASTNPGATYEIEIYSAGKTSNRVTINLVSIPQLISLNKAEFKKGIDPFIITGTNLKASSGNTLLRILPVNGMVYGDNTATVNAAGTEASIQYIPAVFATGEYTVIAIVDGVESNELRFKVID